MANGCNGGRVPDMHYHRPMTASWKPAVCSVTFRRLPAQAVISHASAAGMAAIEWGGDVHVPAGNLTLAADLGAATRAAGMSVGSYGTYLFAGSERGLRGAPPADPEALIATATALGAPAVRVWAGATGSAKADAATRRRVADALREVCAAASDAQLAVSVEYHPDTLTDDADSALALFDAVAADNLFTHWQPRPGLDIDTALAELTRLAPWLSYLHVFAWDHTGRRYPLADHADYWQRVLEHLATLAPGPRWCAPRWAVLEFVAQDAPAQFDADAATLRGWLTT